MPLSGDSALDALHARVLSEKPASADAIIWLQGNGYDRGPRVLELFRADYAPFVVISGNHSRSPITVDHLADWLEERGVPADGVMVDASSFHTRDQAVYVLDLAVERAWWTVLLVGSPHHQLRAFLTFCKRAKKIGWGGRIVNQPVAFDWDAIPSELEQSARVVFDDELTKCRRYYTHVSTAREGLTYLNAWQDATGATS